MKKYNVKSVMMDEYEGLRATVEIAGKEYSVAEQVHEAECGIERGGADCYYFINDNENPDFSDVFPVEDEDEGRELYNAIIESMIALYEEGR